MLKAQIKIGETYAATISGKRTLVRIDSVDERKGYGPNSRTTTRWSGTNLTTGRAVTIKSAASLQPSLSKLFKDSPSKEVKETATIVEAPSSPSTASEAETEPVAVTEPPKPLADAIVSREAITAPAGIVPGSHLDRNGYHRPLSERLETKRDKRWPFIPTAEPVVKPNKQPTEEQRLILAAVQRRDPVLVVEAGAGTGKTTTLKMIGETLTGRGQYTAFNSSLVAESKEKFQGTRVDCNTTHSLGFRAEGNRFGHRLGGQRVRSEQIAKMLGIEAFTIVLKGATETEKAVEKRLAPGFLASLVMGAIKRFCQSDEAEVSPSHFRYVDGIDMPENGERRSTNNRKVRDYLLPFAEKAWLDLSNPKGELPFSHDHYVKVWQLNKPVISADYILLDEAQDTAPVMLDILRQQKCQVIIVGDSAQQIYEWRGAVNALGAFEGAETLFLSQSFRFGTAIADVANAVLDTLDEPTKLRLKGLPSIPSKVEPLTAPKAILCRTNARAVGYLLSAINEGKRPFLIGGGGDVISFVEAAKDLMTLKPTSHPDLACFSSWTEVQEYVKLDEGEDLQLMVKLIGEFGADAILVALKAMPAKEADADLVITTAHKSKGREWESVQLASDFPTKSKCGDSDRKLLYVAVTRAMMTLDVSLCPFFTGQDAIEVTFKKPTPVVEGTEEGLLPAVPVVVPPSQPEGFSWIKSDGDKWLVRGPNGHEGKKVQVSRRDGSTSWKLLKKALRSENGVALYQV